MQPAQVPALEVTLGLFNTNPSRRANLETADEDYMLGMRDEVLRIVRAASLSYPAPVADLG